MGKKNTVNKAECKDIEAKISDIEQRIKKLGPILAGTIKKNVNRTKNKNGAIHISPTHHTFTYRNGDGKETWKRIPERDLPAFRKWVEAGREYKSLATRFARLSTQLTLASGGKKNDISRNPSS